MAVQPDAKIEGFGITCSMRKGYKPWVLFKPKENSQQDTYIQFIKNT